MTNRKLQALRNLAERPGTEAEGQVAREMLARAEGSQVKDELDPACGPFPDPGHGRDPLWEAMLADVMAEAARNLRKAMDLEMEKVFTGQARMAGAAERAARSVFEFGEAARKFKFK